MFFKFLLVFLLFFSFSNPDLTAQDLPHFIDFPVHSTTYSPGDSLKIQFKEVYANKSFQISLSGQDKVWFDTLVSVNQFFWVFPLAIAQGSYSLNIQDVTENNQKVDLEIKDHNFLDYHYQWQKLTNNAAFYPRDGAGLVKFKNKFWILGGWHWLKRPTTNSEVFSSVDGINWTFEVKAPWEGRHVAGWTVFKDAIWVVGGDNNRGYYVHDIWKSYDGINWIQVVAEIPIPERALHLVTSINDKLYIMGGEQIPLWGTTGNRKFADIWSSQDGVEWELEKEVAEFGERGMVIGDKFFKDSLWVIGGGTYEPRNYYNDVWNSSDGVNWNLVKNSAAFPPRQYHSISIFDNKLWLTGGYNADLGGDLNDVWYSEDGRNWINLPGTPWSRRHAHSVIGDEDGLLLLGGPQEKSDVWKLYREIDQIRHSEDRDTLYVQKGFRREVYTDKSKGFVYQWTRNDQVISSSNRIFVNDFGSYQLKVRDVMWKEISTEKIHFLPIEFNLAADSLVLFKNDVIRNNEIFDDKIYAIDEVTNIQFLTLNGNLHKGTLQGDGKLISLINFKDNPSLSDTIFYKVITPKVILHGDNRLLPGESLGLSIDYLPGYRYQWFKDGKPLAQQDSSKLLANLPGSYQVEIYRDSIKLYSSEPVAVSIRPFAFSLPRQVQIFEGDALKLSVDHYEDVTYQWTKDQARIQQQGSSILLESSGLFKLFVKRIDGSDLYLIDSIKVDVSIPPIPSGTQIVIPAKSKYILEIPAYFNTEAFIYKENNLIKTDKAGRLEFDSEGYFSVVLQGNSIKASFDSIEISYKYMTIREMSDNQAESMIVLEAPTFNEVTYNWYLNGVLLEKSTSPRLYANQTGIYQAVLVTKDGQAFNSNELNIKKMANLFSFRVNQNSIEVINKSAYVGDFSLSLYDLTGKKLVETSGVKTTNLFKFNFTLANQLPSHFYILRFVTKDYQISEKVLIKQ